MNYNIPVCVDFDGTVVDHRYPRTGEDVPGALMWLKRWQAIGIKIILWTMRDDKGPQQNYLAEAKHFLEGRGIKLHGVNNNPDQASWTNSPKAYGQIYIDDAAFGCPLIKPDNFERSCVDWSVVGPAVWEQVTGKPVFAYEFHPDGRVITEENQHDR